MSGWKAAAPHSGPPQKGDIRTGRGFAFGTFANSQVGMVADIEVSLKTGKIVAKHLYIAHVNGVSMSPDLVANQNEGAAIQGLSRALYEGLTFNKERITSTDWVTYPILRIKDAPHLTRRRSSRRRATWSTLRAAASNVQSGQHRRVQRRLEPDRRRRAADGADRGRGRERVLRRHGCAHP